MSVYYDNYKYFKLGKEYLFEKIQFQLLCFISINSPILKINAPV
jgi:hypothetical protein